MELRHLRYFVAVAEEENISKAAARLHVSQPPLSRQIRDLEEELGVPLFERTPKAVRLTAVGAHFLTEARAVLQRAEEAVASVRAAHRVVPRLNVGYAPSPTVELLPPLVKAFAQRKPGAALNFRDLTLDQMLVGLKNGELDAALAVRPSPVMMRGFRFETLRRYRATVCMPTGHRWSKSRGLTREAVLQEALVVYSRKEYPDYSCWLAEILGQSERKIKVSEECDGALSLIAAVEIGRGVAVVIESLKAIAGNRLSFIPFSPEVDPVEVGILYRAKPLSDIVRSFVETALEIAEKG